MVKGKMCVCLCVCVCVCVCVCGGLNYVVVIELLFWRSLVLFFNAQNKNINSWNLTNYT